MTTQHERPTIIHIVLDELQKEAQKFNPQNCSNRMRLLATVGIVGLAALDAFDEDLCRRSLYDPDCPEWLLHQVIATKDRPLSTQALFSKCMVLTMRHGTKDSHGPCPGL